MSELYDVVIIGPGPGGATAAYFLGAAGKRVLIIEKETLPRYKACGGGISAHVLKETFPFSFEAIIETQVKAVTYAFGEQQHIVPTPEHGLQTVMRAKFDAHILAHAQADVWPGIAVRNVTELADRILIETSDGRMVVGRYLIGAGRSQFGCGPRSGPAARQDDGGGHRSRSTRRARCSATVRRSAVVHLRRHPQRLCVGLPEVRSPFSGHRGPASETRRAASRVGAPGEGDS